MAHVCALALSENQYASHGHSSISTSVIDDMLCYVKIEPLLNTILAFNNKWRT